MRIDKARGEAAVLVLVVFLLGVVLGGWGTHLWGARVFGMPAPPSPRAQYIADLARQVQITPEQQEQLNSILDETKAQWAALYHTLDPQKEQIRQEGHARMRALLTPEQQPKFDAYMERLAEQHKQQRAAQASGKSQ